VRGDKPGLSVSQKTHRTTASTGEQEGTAGPSFPRLTWGVQRIEMERRLTSAPKLTASPNLFDVDRWGRNPANLILSAQAVPGSVGLNDAPWQS
jgi:hypothetical protein